MAPLYWMKLWYEILDDPKIGMLSDHLKWTAIQMFLVAGEHNKEGLLPSIPFMAWRLRVQEAQLTKDLDALSNSGIVQLTPEGWFVTNFKTRQEKPPKAEYMRRKRERDREDRYNGWGQHVTTGNNSVNNDVTNSNTDTDTDTDTDEDKDQTRSERPQKTLRALEDRANMLNQQELLAHLSGCSCGEKDPDTFIIVTPDQETRSHLMNEAANFIHDVARGFSGYRNVEIK